MSVTAENAPSCISYVPLPFPHHTPALTVNVECVCFQAICISVCFSEFRILWECTHQIPLKIMKVSEAQFHDKYLANF